MNPKHTLTWKPFRNMRQPEIFLSKQGGSRFWRSLTDITMQSRSSLLWILRVGLPKWVNSNLRSRRSSFQRQFNCPPQAKDGQRGSRLIKSSVHSCWNLSTGEHHGRREHRGLGWNHSGLNCWPSSSVTSRVRVDIPSYSPAMLEFCYTSQVLCWTYLSFC